MSNYFIDVEYLLDDQNLKSSGGLGEGQRKGQLTMDDIGIVFVVDAAKDYCPH